MPTASMALLSFSRLPRKIQGMSSAWTKPMSTGGEPGTEFPLALATGQQGLQGYKQPVCEWGCISSGMTVALAIPGSLQGAGEP